MSQPQSTRQRLRATEQRYRVDDLVGFAGDLFRVAGLPEERAAAVASFLVEGDLLGHTTHGLQLVPRHLEAIGNGAIARTGEPAVLADRGSAVLWDGRWLPGPWLVAEALALAFERIGTHPVVTVVLRRSGHIGCLAAYPRLAIERGLMLLLSSSDPAVALVAPHGAVEGRYTPNPIAAGWPTADGPVILDVCPSTTTAGMVARAGQSGTRLPGPWLIDADGRPSDDPAVLRGEGPGAILPLGGRDLGHKGFALALLVEALTAALGGFGRADRVSQDGAAVFLQVIDPEAFAGRDAFLREAGFVAAACLSARPRPGGAPVRLPGARALALRREQLEQGVTLHPAILPALAPWAERLGIAIPAPIGPEEH